MGRTRLWHAVNRLNQKATGRGLKTPGWQSIFELAFVILVRKAKKGLRATNKTGIGSLKEPAITETCDC
jgi:hypothetical protein